MCPQDLETTAELPSIERPIYDVSRDSDHVLSIEQYQSAIENLREKRESATDAKNKVIASFDLITYHAAYAEELGALKSVEAIAAEIALLRGLLGPSVTFGSATSVDPKGMPAVEKTEEEKSATTRWYDHLDICKQCEQNPFKLCVRGAFLLQATQGKK